MVTVKCPYCKTVFTTSIGVATDCRNRECKARIHVGSDGKIRKTEPPRKKK